MKKSLIAASASAVALAAMPVLGAFATVSGSPIVDKLQVNLLSTCTFSRSTAIPHVAGALPNGSASPEVAGTWTTTSEPHVLSGTIVAGVVYDNFGASNFNVKCNNAEGWQVTAAANALDNDADAQTPDGYTIPVGAPSTTASAWSYASSSNESGEGAYAISNTGTFTTANNTIASGANPTGNNGVSFKVQYAVSAAYNIPEDTYEGTIEYTLAELPTA